MLRFLVLLLALSAPAVAQESYPRLHDVTGVAADDTLNVRASPSSKAPVVGELAFDAKAIEVMREENGWGLINVHEQTGWAYLRYLAPRVDGDLANVASLSCYGTEPFWGLDIHPGQTARLSTPDGISGLTFHVGSMRRLYAPLMKHTILGTGAESDLSVVITQANCNDGMSDREYVLDATVFLSGAETRAYSGCCQLAD